VIVFSDLAMWFVQIGDGTTLRRRTPVAVVGLGSGMVAIAVGDVGLFLVTWRARVIGVWLFVLLIALV
jgi:hypothetical protein